MPNSNNQNNLSSGKSDSVFVNKRFPIGISSFKKIIEGNYLFADKSLFIKDVIENGAKVILITRPRRFGKLAHEVLLIRGCEN